MNSEDLIRLLPTKKPVELLIQLPDNEPPVNFKIDYFDDLIILFPTPPDDQVWDHDNNVIKTIVT